MKKENKDFIIIGFALFAMFFGAGNLIFPPSLGVMAGDKWVGAILGFFLTGIGLPILGILAISKSGGTVKGLAGKVGPKFSVFYGTVVIIALGPLLAVPRTGATTFEMGVKPIFPSANPIIVSIIYFSITLLLVIKPTGIIDRIGKILTPVLLLTLSFIIYKGVTSPIGAPVDTSITNPLFKGFTEGYQTMDLLGATLLGGLITGSLIEKGYKDKKEQFRITAKAGIVAGLGLLFVYGGLLYLGATASSTFPEDIAKTTLTMSMVSMILGDLGKVILGISVSCACLTTSVGLTGMVGDYFSELTKGKLSYKLVVTVSTVFSALISNLGVEKIVQFAGPLLSIFYPVAIVLVVLNLFDKYIKNKKVYAGAVFGALLVSLIDGISGFGINTSFIGAYTSSLPLSEGGLGWVLPAMIGLLLTSVLTSKRFKYSSIITRFAGLIK